MDISQRDKVMLLVGASIGVIVIGIALESVQTYAASKQQLQMTDPPNPELVKIGKEYLDGILRGSANGSQTDAATERSSDGPTAVSTPSLAGAASVKSDILEPAYTHNGVPEEFRVSE